MPKETRGYSIRVCRYTPHPSTRIQLVKVIEIGTLRQMQTLATALLGKYGGTDVTICRDKRLVCRRNRGIFGEYTRWVHNKHFSYE